MASLAAASPEEVRRGKFRKNRARRMVKEITELRREEADLLRGPYLFDFALVSPSEMQGYIIGPEGSVYDGAVLRFTATLPDAYPFKPAVVSFVDTVVHPLVEGGHRFSHCMSKANWCPAYTTSRVLESSRIDLAESPFGLAHEGVLAEYKEYVKQKAAQAAVTGPMCLFYTHRWAPGETHRRFPRPAREWVVAVLMCAKRLSGRAVDAARAASRGAAAGDGGGGGGGGVVVGSSGSGGGSAEGAASGGGGVVLPALPEEMWFRVLSEVTMAGTFAPQR